jgi:hypothetical protein
MAGRGKLYSGILDRLFDNWEDAKKALPDTPVQPKYREPENIISNLPEDINDLPSYKTAVRTFKRSGMGDLIGMTPEEKLEIPDAEVDAERIGMHAQGFDSDKDIFRLNRDPFDDWAAGKIELQDFQNRESPTSEQAKFGTPGDLVYPMDPKHPSIENETDLFDLMIDSNYSLDPRTFVLRDLEMNYGLSKPEIMDYLKKNDLIVGKPADDFNFNDQQMKALKDAFASGDPDNPIVKRVRGALADLVDEDDLIEVTPEMIHGKPN